MKNKIRIFATLIAALICLGGFSVTAYAGGGEDCDYYTEPEATESVEPEVTESTESEETATESQSLTPDGNLTLVDDIESEATEDKQFITVQTKDGNYFYIVIDRSDDTDNVYFLNLVDEADLLALITDEDIQSQDTSSVTETTTEPEETTETADTDEQQEDETDNNSALVVLLVVLLLGGGGALVYFKMIKPKKNIKGGVDLDEYDFDDDAEDGTNEGDGSEQDFSES